MRNIVLLGADGMLGRCWDELLEARGIAHVATTIDDLDITDSAAVEEVVKPGTEWVVNCAAYTLVDDAETHADLANEVNGHAVGRLAKRCKAVGAKLLHYSTDYVFDGTASEPYRTDHPRNPGERVRTQQSARRAAHRRVGGRASFGAKQLALRALGDELRPDDG